MRIVSNEDALIADVVRRQEGVTVKRTRDAHGNRSVAISFDALALQTIPGVESVRVQMGVGREFETTSATVERGSETA